MNDAAVVMERPAVPRFGLSAMLAVSLNILHSLELVNGEGLGGSCVCGSGSAAELSLNLADSHATGCPASPPIPQTDDWIVGSTPAIKHTYSVSTATAYFRGCCR